MARAKLRFRRGLFSFLGLAMFGSTPERDSEGNYVLRGVAIWDEHEDFSKDEKGEYVRPESLRKVDKATLELFAEKTNHRIRDTKERLPVAIGVHTPKPGEKHAPPETIGYYENLQVGRIGYEKPRAAILADLKIEPQHWEKAKAHQRRSIELYPYTGELDTLVLLGSKSPARPLGPLTQPVHYDRSRGACVRYEMQGAQEATTMDQPTTDGGVTLSAETLQTLAGLLKTSVMEGIQEIMSQDEQPAPEGELPMEPDGDEGAGADMLADQNETDTTPGDVAVDEEAQKYERHDMAVQYARQERELAEMKAKFAEIEGREIKARYEKQVIALQSEGYAVNTAEEMPYLMSLPNDETRNGYIERLRKNAKKIPRYGGPVAYANPEDPTRYETANVSMTGGIKEENIGAIHAYARKNNCSWEEAKAAVGSR